MLKPLHYSVLFIFMLILISCEQGNPELAKVGSKSISLHEFEQAYRFNPYLAGIKNDSTAKKSVLNTLIAEKLLATEAENLGLNQGQKFKRMSRQFNREAVIEQLWHEKVFADLTISEQEIQSALLQANQDHVIRYLIFDTKLAAEKAWENLNNNFTYEQIAELNGYRRGEIPRDTVSFGTSIEEMESIVFDLKTSGISTPVKFGNEYVIVKKDGQRERAMAGDNSGLRKKIRKIIFDRKGKQLLEAYIRRHINKIRYDLNRGRFKDIVIRLQNIIFSGTPETRPAEKNLRAFPPGLPEEILQSEIVRFSNDDTWTVKKLLQRLEDGPYPVKCDSKPAFEKSMIAATKMNLENERFYQHGLALGLDKTSEVINETEMWSDFMLAQRMKGILKRDGPQKLQQFISRKYATTTISIRSQQLKTLPSERSDMVVMKTHFPLRTIAPIHELIMTK